MIRRFDGAQNGGLLVAHAPIPRRNEGALPHPGLGFARHLLAGLIIPGQAREGQRPAVRHQPFLDVFAIGLAACHGSAATIDRTGLAGPDLAPEALGDLIARGNATGPALALGVETKLVRGGSIDAAEPDARIAYLDLVGF